MPNNPMSGIMGGKAGSTKAQSKFLESAMEFCRQEIGMRERKRKVRHCSEHEPADPSQNYPGNPPCDLATENLCANCQTRLDGAIDYRFSLRKRGLAKRRMMRWATRMGVTHAE